MPNRRLALAFTGHRPETLPFEENEATAQCIHLKTLIRQEILQRASQGYGTFYCGAARGADILFGEQFLAIKKEHFSDLCLVCVIPYEGQANNWTNAWRDRYFSLLEHADCEVLISARYTSDCYHSRNRYMVDHADALLSVFNGQHSGGTFYTTKYAYQRNKEIVIISPETLSKKVIAPRLQLHQG